MKLKLITNVHKVLSLLSIYLFISGISPVHAQNNKSNSLQQFTNEFVEQIDKVGDEAKAKYAENIDKPYIPVKVNPEYNTEEVKALLTRDLKKFVNYYYASKVPAYRNKSTNLTIKKIYNGEVTNDYVRFTSSEKPVMNEEQRKLFLQGNAMNKQLDYENALIYYEKAISLNPVSYPEGYYNYAIIAALAEKYELAILNMKKYLLMMPDATDAVSAQDKIYEWEALMTKKLL